MPGWQNSRRREELPPDWAEIRQRIFRRDGYRCTVIELGERCPSPATDVDHLKRGDDHRDDNLASKCGAHHAAKTAQEGVEALAKKRDRINSQFRRPEEDHPSSWRHGIR